VFPVLIYDNLTSAVRKILRGRNREEQETFQKFRSYYSFEARFCNPGQGHEKGGVEGLVGYARRNYLVPVPEAADFRALNEQVLTQCVRYGEHRVHGREQCVNALFAEERPRLLALPTRPFANIQTGRVKVNKYATVLVHRNHYSVPPHYVGVTLEAVVSVDTIRLAYHHKEVATHERVYGNNKWQLNPLHYLKLIQQRPQAFDSARPLKQWRQTWPSCLETLLRRCCEAQGQNHGIKDFITVLLLYQDYPADEVEAAVELAVDLHISSSDGVKQVLRASQPEALAPPLSHWASLPQPDVSCYAQLHATPSCGASAPDETESAEQPAGSPTIGGVPCMQA
jgi:hypothetical protein